MISAAASAAITAGRLSRDAVAADRRDEPGEIASSCRRPSRRYQFLNVAFLVFEPIMPT